VHATSVDVACNQSHGTTLDLANFKNMETHWLAPNQLYVPIVLAAVTLLRRGQAMSCQPVAVRLQKPQQFKGVAREKDIFGRNYRNLLGIIRIRSRQDWE
jgi:hypothetical protein